MLLDVSRKGSEPVAVPPATAPLFSGALRLPELDALRALAVFLVVGHHTAWRFAPSPGDPLGQVFKLTGWIGVDIFFAISGFMITGILLRDIDNNDVRGFFVRRFYRIYPLLIAAVCTFAVAAVVTGAEVEKLRYIWSPLFLLNGWTIPFVGYDRIPFTITWSLSIEEFAYICLGLAGLIARRALLGVLLGFLVISVLVRVAVVATGAMPPFDLYFFVPARLDAIALGGFGALGWYAGLLRWPPVRVVSGVAMLGLIWGFQWTGVGGSFMPLVGYSLFGVVCAIFVSSLATISRAGYRTNGLAQVVFSFGRLSYFIYLFHLFVLEALLLAQRSLPSFRLSFWSALVLASAATFGLAHLSWRYFEYPLIRYSKSKSVGGYDEPRRRAV